MKNLQDNDTPENFSAIAEQGNAITIDDFEEYSAILHELHRCCWFIADTTTILEGNQDIFDGRRGSPTPYYANQLNQIMRAIANKQLALLEMLESLTSVLPMPNDNNLDLTEMPRVGERIARKNKEH